MADLIDRGASIRFISNIERDDEDRLFTFEEIKKMLWDAPAVNRWISVEDALPEQSEEGQPPNVKCSDCVLVAACNWIGMAYYVTKGEESQWLFADAQNKPKIDWTVVTHWMPLPEPPEKE